MILASNGIIPPKEWYHDKFIKNYSYTIAEKLSYEGIIPPQHWMITEIEDEDIFYKIKSNL